MLGVALAFSYHLGGYAYDFNYLHPHIRYTTEDSVVAGVYYNSDYKVSTYVGKNLQYDDWALEVGLVTGYAYKIIPYARVTYKDFFLAPAVYGNDNDLGLVLGYEFEIK